jgi:hypothetical protein
VGDLKVNTIYLVDQLKSLVETSVTADYGSEVYFQFGPREEIARILDLMDKDPNQAAQRYPLVALFTDYTEKRGIGIGLYAEVTLNMAVMTLTDKDRTAPDRLTNSFKAVLQPIYDSFIYCLLTSGLYIETSWHQLSHGKTDRYKWGSTPINSLDFVDAIEITNLTLTLIQQNNENDKYSK